MKKILTAAILLMTLLTGCTKGYRDRIDALDEQLTGLKEQLEQQNKTIASLQTILLAVKSRDFITGITQLEGNAGYVVHFSRLDDIVIYHGTDAHVPRVGIQRNSDGNYYWTIQYGNSDPQFIINDTGSMIPAVGLVPLLKIDGGKFYISYDSRKTWQYLGEADGVNGDNIFENIVVTDEYVSFVTAEQEFRIPTNKLVQSLYQNTVTANQNVSSLSKLIKDLPGKDVCVVSVTDLIIDKKPTGSVIKLSSGQTITIRDWIATNGPQITVDKDKGDKVYYWALIYTDGSREWILDEKGKRVAATTENVEIPSVVPVLDTKDNMYYWCMVAAGDTTAIKDTKGNKVPVTCTAGEFAVFKGADNSNPDFLVLTLVNGTKIEIPKIYTVTVNPESISLKAGGSAKTVSYRVYGADKTAEYTLLTQGQLTASITKDSKEAGVGTIRILPGKTFAGDGKVLFMVSAGNGSTKTMTKVINVALEK